MEYNIWGCLFFGLISGLSEFLPVSTLAHQYLYGYLFGFSNNTPFLRLMVYFGCLVAVLVCCRKRLVHIYRELRLSSLPKRRRKRVVDMQAVLDIKLAMLGLIPMILGILLYDHSVRFFSNLPMLCLMLILSGILTYLPMYMVSGFRNSKQLTPLDGLLFGACSALAIIPGLSRIGLLLYAGRARRCSRESMMDLALLFAIPMLLCLVLYHLILVLTGTTVAVTGVALLVGALSALAAFGGGVAAIYFIRFLTVKTDFGGFSFYCWGLAVFTFIYYLIT